jgi:restriction system protein
LHSHPAVAQARFNPIAIAAMSCRDFERMIGETFRRRGFYVAGFGMRAAGGAADLALLKSGERFLVHCLHWRKQEIGVLAVRELNSALQAVRAQGGYVLTAGGFTREASEFARSTRIELIGGERLIAWLRGAEPGERGRRGTRAAKKPALAVVRIA